MTSGRRASLRRALASEVAGRRPAFFLDYDGTLTPIVDRPEQAVLSASMRRIVARLAERHPVAIVSGRDRLDVASRVGIEGIWYVGSHGFDIAGPEGEEIVLEEATRAARLLAEVGPRLERELADIPGAQVESKRFSVAVHYRRVARSDQPRIDAAVERVLAGCRGLRKASGKMVWELRPDLDWDKGRAVLWLLARLGLDGPDVVALYLGDDDTDEDAFRALGPSGIGILVSEAPRPTAARHRLAGCAEVEELLAWFAERDVAREGVRP